MIFSTVESLQKQNKVQNEKLKVLKQLFPEVINSDGQLDINALQDFISLNQTTANNKGYELTFAGKGLAKARASSETPYELKTETEQSKNWHSTENVMIRGDNLEVLKILKANYFAKVKMIYIDPPYNTKSENFIYNDNFKKNEKDLIKDFGLDENTTDFLSNVYGTRSHSGWLAFMYPRLKLARDLLKDDGVIFISIDDNEQANLKILCDEIFGEDNFVAQFVWKTTKSAQGMKTKNMIVNNQEIIFTYAKDSNIFEFIGMERNDVGFSNPDNDRRGAWKRQYLQRLGQNLSKKRIVDPITNISYEFETPYTQEKLERWIEEERIIFPKNKNGYPARKEFLSEYKNNKQLVTSLDLYPTKSYTEKVYKFFDNYKIFNNPKPDDLIKFLIKNSFNTNNDIILDFFAGSGTTGDAVMQLNNEDGGNRKFILVQWDEAIKENTEAYQFCIENNFEPVISSITIERLNRAGAKLKQEQKAKEGIFESEKLDIGYKVFSLKPKPKIIEDDNHLFTLENQREHTTDTVYNMLCATNKPLHTPVQERIADSLYLVEHIAKGTMQKSFYLLNIPNEEIAKQIIAELDKNPDSQIYIDGYSSIKLQNWLNLGIESKESVRVVY